MGRTGRGLTLAFALAIPACAMTPPPAELGPLSPAVRAYSRNPVVCAPTAVGNAIGGAVGYLPALALGFVTFPLLAALPERAADATLRAYFYTLPYLLGLALGTPALPFSYLAPADPCEFRSVSG
jgi:hypothetical protein